jgi:hypothetical protein
MKRFIHAAAIASGLLIVGTGIASAQVTSPVEFKTAFPFTVGNTTVPAGSYTIRPVDDEQTVLELNGTNPHNHIGVIFEITPRTTINLPKESEVVFRKYGDKFVLKDVWVVGEETGAEAVTARAESHHMKHGPKPTEHRVAAIMKASGKSTTVAKGKTTTP